VSLAAFPSVQLVLAFEQFVVVVAAAAEVAHLCLATFAGYSAVEWVERERLLVELVLERLVADLLLDFQLVFPKKNMSLNCENFRKLKKK
jgi:hypothetical protein